MMGRVVLGVAAVLFRLFVSLDVLVSWYPFDMDVAGRLGFMDFVDYVQD